MKLPIKGDIDGGTVLIEGTGLDISTETTLEGSGLCITGEENSGIEGAGLG